MTYQLSRSIGQQCALKVLSEQRITTFPIDPKKIAENIGILLKENPNCERGVSGMLIRVNTECCIVYSTLYNNIGFENFSIAHELGHYFIKGHLENALDAEGIHISKMGFEKKNQYEIEADSFAASLLMPEIILKPRLDKLGAGLSAVEALSNLCKTSLTTSAIRYAELSETFIIIIISTNNVIDYCHVSNTVRNIRNKEIPQRGWKIPKGSKTEILGNNANLVQKAERLTADTDLNDWLDIGKTHYAIEESIGLGKYGKVLTVITL